MTLKFKKRNPFFLLLMTLVGLIYCIPVAGFIATPPEDWMPIALLIIYSPCCLFGLLVNVFSSLGHIGADKLDDNGCTFF